MTKKEMAHVGQIAQIAQIARKAAKQELTTEYRKAIKKAQRLLRKERTSGTVRGYWKTAIVSLKANLRDLEGK